MTGRIVDEYDSFDALKLAELVRAREVSPLDLVEAAIERIERRNPACNAVVHRMYEQARRRAASTSSPRTSTCRPSSRSR